MPQYTEEPLDKLLKRELISIVLSLEEQNRSLQSRMSEVNNKVMEEMSQFSENFSKLQLELSMAKRLNTELNKHVVTLGDCSVLKKGMCRSGSYSSLSR